MSQTAAGKDHSPAAYAKPFLQTYVIYDMKLQRAAAVVTAASPEDALASHEYATLAHQYNAANWVRVDPDIPTAPAVVYVVDKDSKFSPTMDNIQTITNADLTSHASLVGTYICTIPEDNMNGTGAYYSYEDAVKAIPHLPQETDPEDHSPETVRIRNERDEFRQRLMNGEPYQMIRNEAKAAEDNYEI